MKDSFFEDFNIESVSELMEHDSCITECKVYFDPERDEVFYEGLEWLNPL